MSRSVVVQVMLEGRAGGPQLTMGRCGTVSPQLIRRELVLLGGFIQTCKASSRDPVRLSDMRGQNETGATERVRAGGGSAEDVWTTNVHLTAVRVGRGINSCSG